MIISKLENWLITITRVKFLTSNSSDLEYEKKITQYFFLFILYIQHFLGYSGLKVCGCQQKSVGCTLCSQFKSSELDVSNSAEVINNG